MRVYICDKQKCNFLGKPCLHVDLGLGSDIPPQCVWTRNGAKWTLMIKEPKGRKGGD